MADADGDSIWTVTLPLTADSIEYKFTLDGWTGQENLTSGSACTKTTGIYTNRFAAFTGDTILPGVAWESCDAKAGQVYLTMQVNMSYQAVDSTGVFLAGGGNFGNPGDNEMHPIGDSIYSITVAKDTGFTSFFTFTNGACPSWGCKETWLVSLVVTLTTTTTVQLVRHCTVTSTEDLFRRVYYRRYLSSSTDTSKRYIPV